MNDSGRLAALEGQITVLEERIKTLETGMAIRKSAINTLANAIREDRGLEPYDFDEAEKDMP